MKQNSQTLPNEMSTQEEVQDCTSIAVKMNTIYYISVLIKIQY